MKKPFIVAVLVVVSSIFLISNLFAQARISGSVTDSAGKPLPQANVLLLKSADSALVKGTITNDKGLYVLDKIGEGSYFLTYSFSGYHQVNGNAFIIGKSISNLTVNNISLSHEKSQLQQVTVTAKKQLFEQKIDRMVINVSGSITSAGSTALDVLERSPGVAVDRNNNSLSINGKNGVVVMINGKINYMPLAAVVQMLAGMSADNIEKMEIITTPPANLDAQGNAGYINIVLKTNANFGTNGTISLSAGYGNKETGSADISVNHRKGKVNLYGSYSFSRAHQLQLFEFYRKVTDQKTLETATASDRDPVRHVHSVRFGIDYQLSKKTIIGGILAAYDNVWKMDAVNRVNITVNNRLDTLLRINNNEINHWKNLLGNFNVQHTIDSVSKITADLDYVYYWDSNPTNYDNMYFDAGNTLLFRESTRTRKLTPINIAAGKIDYTTKISKKLDLETGVKYASSGFINDIGVAKLFQNNWKADDSLTAKYKLLENIAAGYASTSFAINDKTTLKAGLRYEYTTSNLGTEVKKDIVDRKYGRLFPTVYFSRKLNDKHSINLAYNRRITRPSFDDLAPFVIFVDPNTFISGNPALQPSIIDAIKGDYLFKSFIFSITYSYEKDPIASFQTKVNPKNNKQYITAENLIYAKTVNLNLSLPFTVTSWWNMQNNLSGLWQRTKAVYEGSQIHVQQFSGEFFSQQNFTLPKNFTAELSGFYSSGGVFGRSFFRPISSLNVGVQKKLGEKGGSLRFGVDNVLNTLKFRAYQDFPQYNLVSNMSIQFSTRLFKLTYTRKFGNSILKGQRERSTGSDDERKRVNSQ